MRRIGGSLLEKKMASLLHARRILFETEKTLPGMVHKADLRCDFFIPPGVISPRAAIIEVDGPHHFADGCKRSAKMVPFDRETVVRDRVKNRYASANGMHLMRADFTIYPFYDKVLQEFLDAVKQAPDDKQILYFFGELYGTD